ncbi:MAG: TetR/AcrR family transcriptional regulator [Oceanicaulis sp.]
MAAETEKDDARPSTPDLILDAAERVVAREGARRLTIDAVVKESGFSKGGVLYNFPSKLDLIKGMVARMVTSFTEDHAAAMKQAEADGTSPLQGMVQALLRKKEDDMERQVSMGLLAAIAENPELIDPIRDALAAIREDLIAHAPDPVLASVVLLAADGLHFSDILGLDVIGEDDRAAVEARLLSLVSEPSR